MSLRINRRRLLETSALMGASVLLTRNSKAAPPRSVNEKLNIGVIGIANQGAYNLESVQSENIVALCDVDDNYLAATAQRFPRAVTYNDYRKMLERKDLDAVVIATPDHTHAPATLAALETGRHVYCEKPLTHTVVEARRVAEAAKKYKRVTQMGTQIHASNNYRRVVELIQSGAIGAVTEAHAGSGESALESLAGFRADAPLSTIIRSGKLARVLGVRRRDVGRYGLSSCRFALLGARPAVSERHFRRRSTSASRNHAEMADRSL